MGIRRLVFLAAVIVAIGAISLGVTTCTTQPPKDSGAVVEPVSPFIISVPDAFHFLQKDPRWADAEMGSSGGSIADYGCTLTSVSMAAANLGIDTDPGELNAKLSAAGGYTERGWLRWNTLEEVTDGALSITVFADPDGTQIDRCLTDGHYPVVKFMLDDRVQHWALVIGKIEGDWAVRDPLDETRTVRPLSDLTSRFESVRCIRPGNRS